MTKTQEITKEYLAELENQGYHQIGIVQGMALAEKDIEDFEKFALEELGGKIKYLETVKTKPDIDENGNAVPGTGGRSDVFVAIHEDSIKTSFSIKRLQFGIRWLEDVIKYNNHSYLYSTEILEKYPPKW